MTRVVPVCFVARATLCHNAALAPTGTDRVSSAPGTRSRRAIPTTEKSGKTRTKPAPDHGMGRVPRQKRICKQKIGGLGREVSGEGQQASGIEGGCAGVQVRLERAQSGNRAVLQQPAHPRTQTVTSALHTGWGSEGVRVPARTNEADSAVMSSAMPDDLPNWGKCFAIASLASADAEPGGALKSLAVTFMRSVPIHTDTAKTAVQSTASGTRKRCVSLTWWDTNVFQRSREAVMEARVARARGRWRAVEILVCAAGLLPEPRLPNQSFAHRGLPRCRSFAHTSAPGLPLAAGPQCTEPSSRRVPCCLWEHEADRNILLEHRDEPCRPPCCSSDSGHAPCDLQRDATDKPSRHQCHAVHPRLDCGNTYLLGRCQRQTQQPHF